MFRRSSVMRSPIKVTIQDPKDIFHELDPSPLIGRDLNERLESYILETARELPRTADLRLEVDVAQDRAPSVTEQKNLSDAITAYFSYRRDQEWRRLRSVIREGRGALAVGLIFLLSCGVAGVLSQRAWSEPFGTFLKEGLLIIGWVALWRPTEMLLYDWRPIRREWHVLDRLAKMDVTFDPARTSL